MLPQNRVERFVNERRFAAAAHTGHADEGAQRKFDVDIFQVITRRAAQFQEVAISLAAFFWRFNAFVII